MARTRDQSEALEQLWSVTASESVSARDRDERLLRENGWDVQRTIEQIFSMEPDPPSTTPSNFASSSSVPLTAPLAAPSSSSSSSTRFPSTGTNPTRSGQRKASTGLEGLGSNEHDDAMFPTRAPPGARRLSGSGMRRPQRTTSVGLSGFGLIVWPFTMLFSVLTGAWYLFIRTFVPLSFLPHLPRFLLPPPSRSPPTGPRDPITSSIRFIRDLEQLTGGSTATSTLPDFWIGSYRDFTGDVRRQLKIGLVVLTCGEHEDDEEFKRDVLCDEEFVKSLKDNDVMVWGADVRTREGYMVSQTLLATTYPSLYFLSLLPVPNSSSPRLSIVTSLSGPPSTSTSTSSILQVLSTSVLPRTSALLSRLRRERAALEESRHLRQEQDRAFREAEKRDREKMEASKRAADAERIKKERAEKEAAKAAKKIEDRKVWRRYARKMLLPPSSGPVKIALRTPLSPDRNVRQFEVGPSTLPLYIYAETLLIPPGDKPEDDPTSPPEGYEHSWGFKIVTTYPRREIELVEEGSGGIGEEVWAAVQKAGGALMAEKIEGGDWCDAEIKELRGGEESDEEVVDDSD